jgi:myo-inositol-1-phosphate synthase
MMKRKPIEIEKAPRTLGVLLPGLGAVATTFIAGVEAIKRGLAEPVGSFTQMGRLRLGRRDEHRSSSVRELVPLAPIDSLRFGAWDIFGDNAYEAARKAKVLDGDLLGRLREPLEAVRPKEAVFDQSYVRQITGGNLKKAAGKRDLVEALRQDIRDFKEANDCDRAVMIWCASTERSENAGPCHRSVAQFERGLAESDPRIPPSQLYAYAAMLEGVPFVNGAPNRTVELPAFQEAAREHGVPIAGSDFKTGQTLLKTLIAPGLKARLLGLSGWYSTNILGNRDGEVLADPGSCETKKASKLSSLENILDPETYPTLYGRIHHQVCINYYPPRGDNKEGWDNIDIFGWLGYPMQIKINFLCRDSILAAPLVLDLALFTDLAARAGLSGIQEWLSFYFKAPLAAEGIKPEHDLMAQQMKLHNTLRWLGNERLLTHLGMAYYGVAEE